jgi:hypothetical protein
MGEKGITDLEEQALGSFRQSYNRRYEQWKKKDLLAIAVQTMPKQVKNGEALSKQAKTLEFDRVYNKELEDLETLRKQKKIDEDTYLRLWQILAYSRMTQAGYVHSHTSPDGTKMYFKEP